MKRRLRVLVTADVVGQNLTGVGVATRMMVDALRDRDDIDVSVLISGDSVAADWGVPFVRADWRFGSLPFVITRHRKLESFDVIHCSTVRVPFVGRPDGPALVMTIHDLVPLVAPEYHTIGHRLYFRHFLARSLRRFDAVVTDSEATRRDVIQKLEIAPENVTAVPLYSRWAPRADAEESRRGDFVLAVGTIEPRKNIRRVVEAFLEVRARNPALRHRLVVAGAAGWVKEDPFRGSMALKDEIEWRGYVSDDELYDLYRNAAVLVYPSLHEGFGLPPLEAMSLGCPVITSNSSSLPEVGGDAVMYVDPEDSTALADVVERVLEDGRILDDMRARGFRQAAAFSSQGTGDRLEMLYRKVLES